MVVSWANSRAQLVGIVVTHMCTRACTCVCRRETEASSLGKVGRIGQWLQAQSQTLQTPAQPFIVSVASNTPLLCISVSSSVNRDRVKQEGRGQGQPLGFDEIVGIILPLISL